MIKDGLVLLFYRLFSVISVPEKVRQKNYDNNMEAWNKYKNRFKNDIYIEHQDAMSLLSYGRRYCADYNSCEVIAVYNALIDLKRNKVDIDLPDFPMLLSKFEKAGITWGGAFGTSPFALMKYFISENYNIKWFNYKKWNCLCNEETEYERFVNTYDTFIFMTYNNAKSVKDMIHTMSITKDTGYYQIHNDYEGSKKYDSLKAAVSGYKSGRSKMILLFGIKK